MVVYSCEGGYREGPDYWRDPDWKRWLPVCVCVCACVREGKHPPPSGKPRR